MSRRRERSNLCGLLLIDKPSGMTSFDVVARLRKILGVRRIGHTGTLDPMATGLMAVLVGRATKLSPFVTDSQKSYEATVRLGVETNTYDAEGLAVAEAPTELLQSLSETKIEEAVDSFRGPIQQRPPAFSAIKVDGERLYAKARRGEEVTAPVRDVVVHELKLTRVEVPEVDFFVSCSKGTYIRSIAHDLGVSLKVGGHLTALRRTRVGTFELADAWTLEALEDKAEDSKAGALRPMVDAVSHLPLIRLNQVQTTDVRNGKRFRVEGDARGICRAIGESGHLVAIVEVDEEQELRVVRGIPAS